MPRSTKASTQRKSQPRVAKPKPAEPTKGQSTFDQTYPTIADWIRSTGWIEIGRDDGFCPAMVRAFDWGGTVWESDKDYASMDDLFRDLEKGLLAWQKENDG
jgi:hypothetical protein